FVSETKTTHDTHSVLEFSGLLFRYTERVHEISNSLHAEVYINVQGDEPMTRPEHIASLLGLMENPAVQVGTLATPASSADITNIQANKVVVDLAGRALYF